MPERHLKIGLDIDDVLFRSAPRSIELYNQQFGTALTLDDWYSFSDPKKWGPRWGSDDLSVLVGRVVHDMGSTAFLTAEPMPGAARELRKLQESGDELFAVTGRSESIRPQTLELLELSYPGVFNEDNVHFTDHFQHDGRRVSKADIAIMLGLTDFAEDLPDHANQLAEAGIRTWLFDLGYPWSQVDVHPDIVRVHEWKELGERLRAESVAD